MLLKIFSKYNFTGGVCAKDYNGFDEVIREIMHKFTDVIKDIGSLPTMEEYRFDYMADPFS